MRHAIVCVTVVAALLIAHAVCVAQDVRNASGQLIGRIDGAEVRSRNGSLLYRLDGITAALPLGADTRSRPGPAPHTTSTVLSLISSITT